MTISDWLLRGVNVVHRTVFRASKGRVAGRGLGMPVLELATTGRKSGRRRTTMLTSPLRDDDAIVIVASKGGDDRDPEWYLNLCADPSVEVTMRGGTRPMTARVATGAERDALWERIVSDHANYAGYQRKTERVIPVVVLEPTRG